MPAPKPLPALERKFWFDELYQGLFYWPAVGISRTFFWVVEGPLVGGSITAVTGLARLTGGRVRELQTGLVRTYVFGLAAGLAVLVLVFVAVK